MNATANVVRHNQQSNTVYKHIQSFLRNKGVKSKNTMAEYESDIRQFFRYFRNKDIEQLTEEDLYFLNSDMMDYQTYLSTEHVKQGGGHYSNTSVNRKIASIISLYTFLKRNGYNVDPEMLKVDDLASDGKPRGYLAPDEVVHMCDVVLNQRLGEEKRALIMLALRTGLRKDALLNLKWSQITPHPSKEDYYLITTFDKGSQQEKEIHKKMYEVLLSEKRDEERVFCMDVKTVNKMMETLCKDMGIGEYRNITFHSIKKASGQYVYDETGGDIYAVQKQLGHKSINTSAKYYMAPIRNMAAAIDEEKDKGIFEELSREEMLELLKSFNNGLSAQLISGAKKIIEERK